MIPRSIQNNLAGLRWRERLILLAWGGACWLAVVLGLLGLCVLADWAIDRDRDTPWAVRYALFAVQVVGAVAAALWFVLWPQLRRLRDDDLALYVEEKVPEFRHRLITAVQLNRPGARVEGMSPELVAVVTREAEKQAARLRFASLADHRRLGRAAALTVPLLALAALPLLVWPETMAALLERQALRDVEVPRRFQLEDATAMHVWPAGEKGKLLYRVLGPDLGEGVPGLVTIRPEGEPAEQLPLEYLRRDKDGAALYAAEVPPRSADFVHQARLGDGRSRQGGAIRYVPRPVVTEQKAWVRLPEFCGVRPDGSCYEQPQGRGDVVGIPGSQARIVIAVQRPIASALLEVLVPEAGESPSGEATGPEVCRRVVPMTLGTDGQSAEALVELRAEETGYRVLVVDPYGFHNVPPPRRGLRVVPEESPQVFLLRDSFGPSADSDLEGIPVPAGGSIRIPYVAHGPYGLGGARVLYRPLEENASGDAEAKVKPWVALALPEVRTNTDSGDFDPKRGVFQNTGFDQEVPFYAVPSPAPETLLGRTLGGGRCFLRTGGLLERDERGGTVPLKIKTGTKIEYLIEVFADRQDYAAQPDPNRPYAARRPWARSEARVTEVVTFDQFRAWSQAVADEENRLRKLDSQQRGVFTTGKTRE